MSVRNRSACLRIPLTLPHVPAEAASEQRTKHETKLISLIPGFLPSVVAADGTRSEEQVPPAFGEATRSRSSSLTA